MTHPNNLPETIYEGVRLRQHPDHPMFRVAEDGRVLSHTNRWIGINNTNDRHIQVSCRDKAGRQCYALVHRLVALCYLPNPDPATLTMVDHLDNNPLHNHASNLRWATKRMNCQNLVKNKTGKSSSKYVGVSWKKRERKFFAQIRLDSKNKGLGQFNVAEDAARAYDTALIRAGLAPVNFPA